MKNIQIKTFFLLTFFIFFSMLCLTQQKKDPVNFRELIKFLVDLKDFEGEKPEGQNISAGNFKASEAERQYKSGEKEIEIKIADYSYYPMMKQGLEMMGNFEVDSSKSLVKKIDLDGNMAILEIQFNDKEGKLVVFLKNSILVIFDCQNITDKNEIIAISKQIDLNGLGEL